MILRFFFLCWVALAVGVQLGLRDYRFFHNHPLVGPVDVYVNGRLVFANLQPETVSPLVQDLEVETFTRVAVVSPGKPQAVIANSIYNTPLISSWAVTLQPHPVNNASLVVTPFAEPCAAFKPFLIETASAVQIYNLDSTHQFKALDVEYENGYLVQLLPENNVSDFIEIAAGPATLRFFSEYGSFKKAVEFQPGTTYAAVLWGSAASPPHATLTPIVSCRIPFQLPALPPAPFFVLSLNLDVATAAAKQAAAEWSAAINGYLSGNPELLDTFWDTWTRVEEPSRFFIVPHGDPQVSTNYQLTPLLNSVQAKSGIQHYLNHILKSKYRHTMFPPVLLNDVSFLVTLAFNFQHGNPSWNFDFQNEYQVDGLLTLAFRWDSMGNFFISHFDQLLTPPPPPVTLAEANSISALFDSAVQSSFASAHAPPGNTSFLKSLQGAVFSNTAAVFAFTNSTHSPRPNLVNLSLVLTPNSGSFTYVRDLGTSLLNAHSFVHVCSVVHVQPGVTNVVLFTHAVFTRQPDAESFRVQLYDTFTPDGVETFITLRTAVDITGNNTAALVKGRNLAMSAGRTLTLSQWYYQSVWYTYFTEQLLTANPLSLSRTFFTDSLANAIESSLNRVGFTFSLQARTVAVLSESLLLTSFEHKYTNGTTTFSGLTQLVWSRHPDFWALPTYKWKVVALTTFQR